MFLCTSVTRRRTRRLAARTSVCGGVGAGAFLVNPSPPSRRAVAAAGVAGGGSVAADRVAGGEAAADPRAGAVAAARVADVFSCCFSSCVFKRISPSVRTRVASGPRGPNSFFLPFSIMGWPQAISFSSSNLDCFLRTQFRRSVHAWTFSWSSTNTASWSSCSHRCS